VIAGSGPVIPNFGSGTSCVQQNNAFCWSWVQDHWSDTLQPALLQHIELTAIALGVGFVIAFALALLTLRFGRTEQPIGIAAALLYTIPSLALYQLLVPVTGLTTATIEIALVTYTLVLLYPNIVAGFRAAPPDTLEAAYGMGLTRRQVFTRVQLPLALPSILAGVRIATVSTITVATIAATISELGLGYPIFYALGLQPAPFKTEIYAAGFLVVALALVCDALLVGTRRLLVPWQRAAR
jgi:osmoprotectant transport system permease protein